MNGPVSVMNQLLLAPTDILFFRDGRPMTGSLAGHTAAWPLPTVVNAALHAALWRSGLQAQAHHHARVVGDQRSSGRVERFGSLISAGPFPVLQQSHASIWYFPAPADARYINDPGADGQPICTLRPASPLPASHSSCPLPLLVGNARPPTKERGAGWWSLDLWEAYLGNRPLDSTAAALAVRRDEDIADRESTIGIGIDPERGTQDGKSFYSAHYLRLREGWRMGIFAETAEKTETRGKRLDLIDQLLGQEKTILIGGQQRTCTVERRFVSGRLPLPLGKRDGFAQAPLPAVGSDREFHLVKWSLLTPAIFPPLATAVPAHPGGWLPAWVHPETHAVQLRVPVPPRDPEVESRETFRRRAAASPFISAQLVAALVGKPIPVTGWSLGTPDNPDGEPHGGGARAARLAVPSGSVYYFACPSASDARALAEALNWHGATAGTEIRHRRSAIFGEKGFGLGACGTWVPLV